MREILFRGKEIETGEWITGSLLSGYLENGRTQILNHDNGDWEDVIPETFGQFTGLTDKNGKKIFEGDILHSNYHSEYDKAVFFDNGRFRWKFIHSCGIYDAGSENCVCFQKEALGGQRIIGNIYDNPELLK
jgi:uncharacterized phage protein (TIGR01671 family)